MLTSAEAAELAAKLYQKIITELQVQMDASNHGCLVKVAEELFGVGEDPDAEALYQDMLRESLDDDLSEVEDDEDIFDDEVDEDEDE